MAAARLAGGRRTKEHATATPAAASKMIAMRCPGCPATVASRCPGSGLAAGDLTPDRPSGNSTVLRSSVPGWVIAHGATIAAKTAQAAAAHLAAARGPYRTASNAQATGMAGQAVAFIPAARPSSAPAATGCPSPATAAFRRPPRPGADAPAKASPRQIKPRTGRSLPLTVSGNAISGVATANAVSRTQWPSGAPLTRNAAAHKNAKTAAAQSRGSVSSPGPNSACGSPNTVIAGR